ncbi:hypothetical protein C8R45DRAFT_1147317 [Mycena sanguinolenta]|nr:hypothetical protein C8R45DRAFT_1147317 [Mycena sanguinolenta]
MFAFLGRAKLPEPTLVKYPECECPRLEGILSTDSGLAWQLTESFGDISARIKLAWCGSTATRATFSAMCPTPTLGPALMRGATSFGSRPSPSLAWELFTPPITDAEPAFEFGSGPNRIGIGSKPNSGNTIHTYCKTIEFYHPLSLSIGSEPNSSKIFPRSMPKKRHTPPARWMTTATFLLMLCRTIFNSGGSSVASNFTVSDDGGIARSGTAEASDAEDDEGLVDAAPPALGRGQRKEIAALRYLGPVWEGH